MINIFNNKEIKKLEKKVQDLNVEIDGQKDYIKNILQENNNLKLQIQENKVLEENRIVKDKNIELHKLENTIEAKQMIISQYKKDKDLLIKKNTELSDELDKCKKQINNNENISKLEKTIEAKQMIITKYRKIKDSLIKKNTELSDELDKCKKQINNNENISKLEKTIEAKQMIISQYKKDKDSLIKKNTKLSDELSKCKKQSSDNKYISELESVIEIKEKDILKLKKTIEAKEKINIKYKEYNCSLISKNKELSDEIKKLRVLITDEHYTRKCLLEEINNLQNQKNRIEKEINSKTVELHAINEELTVVYEKKLYEDFCLYQPIYNFGSSAEYKNELTRILDKQKEQIKYEEAARNISYWGTDSYNGKKKSEINNSIKQMLRTFNIECENAINKVKFNNFNLIKKRIQKSYETLNKLNIHNEIEITESYLNLKYDELNLYYEYKLKIQQEKEEAARLREERREELRLQREIEEKRKDLEKERIHYENAMAAVSKKLEEEVTEEKMQYLLDKKANIKQYLEDVINAINDVDYREANYKAGYVYIISNIGAFGSNVYKIGMTRRLEPKDRIDELSNASVPFKFDIHAILFSEDAPKLEASLHKAFEDKKINMVNKRKEFFNVTLEEIEQVVNENYDKSVSFVKIPEAQQYRETLKYRELYK